MSVNLVNNDLLGKNHFENQRNRNLRGHTHIAHPLLKKEIKNGSDSILGFLNSTILNQARNNRKKYLFELAADKCYNSSNSYSFSEARECENQLFSRDAVLNNINNFSSHVEVSFQDQHERAVNGVNCARVYYNQHKTQLLKMNYLYRYYYYFLAKDLFVNSCK